MVILSMFAILFDRKQLAFLIDIQLLLLGLFLASCYLESGTDTSPVQNVSYVPSLDPTGTPTHLPPPVATF
jgi:hypothetical protein